MIKRTLFTLLLALFLLVNTSTVFAGLGYLVGGKDCVPTNPNGYCVDGYSCQSEGNVKGKYVCQPNKIGGADCELIDWNGYKTPNGYCVDGYSCQSEGNVKGKYVCQPNKIGGADCELIDWNGYKTPNGYCVDGYSCQSEGNVKGKYVCQPNSIDNVFGKIQPPPAIAGLLKGDPTGAGGISKFLSNLVVLIYGISTVVLLFMILWGAFDWITSGGEKEKLSNAQKKLINAFIGIIILAVAFAILQVLGTFTGFKFFVGQI